MWSAGLVRRTCPCYTACNSWVGIFSQCRKAIESQGRCSGMWGMGPASGTFVPADLPIVLMGFGSRLEQAFLLFLKFDVLLVPLIQRLFWIIFKSSALFNV